MVSMKLIKDVIRAATYRPDPANPEFKVEITPEVMDHWSNTFEDMKAAEIGIPVTWEHPPKNNPSSDPHEWSSGRPGDPRDRAGWVESLYRDGDTMFAVIDVPDKYAEDLRDVGCYVSPKFGGSWKDSLGREWENPIHHLALTTKPVAVNQRREFVPATTFSRVMQFSTSQGELMPLDTFNRETAVTITPEEAIERILENPDVLARAAEKLGVQEFSATPGMGIPAGMPQDDPGAGMPPMAPPVAPEPEAPDAVATCMQIMHKLSETLHEGMQAMAALHGVNIGGGDDDEDDLPPIPQQPPQPQVTASPAVVSMSRDDLIHNPLYAALEHRQTQTERKQLASRVEALFDSGRATRAKADELLKGINKYEFSRQTELPNVLLLERIKTLEETRPNSAMADMNGQQFSRRPDVVSHNKAFNSEEEMTDERADEILAEVFGKPN